MSRNIVIIMLTFLLAILLMLLQLPEAWQMFRPEWVMLVLVYWALALPKRVGVMWGSWMGLLMDVLLGTHLGLLAFAYALATYLALKFYLQLRQYPVLQQTLPVFFLVIFVKLIAATMAPEFVGRLVWGPALVSAAVWPFIFTVLRWLRRHFHIR